MRAPLAAGFEPAVLWHDTADAPLVTAGDPRPERVDVTVVGAGYCGLAAAIELARRGRSVAVVDRGPLGIGASTRNGGMVLPELKAGPATLAARYGELGERMHRAVEAAFDHVESLAGPDGPIDADYVRSGRLELAHGRRGAAGLRAYADELRAAEGYDDGSVRYLEGAALGAEIGSDAFAAGLVVERSGGLHPAKFHAGLVAQARAVGATVHPSTEVTALEPGTGVRLAGGHQLRADDVLLALNAEGGTSTLSSALRRRVLPMGSFIIATEPLTPAQQASVLPTGRMAYDTINLLSYWRLDPDGRMVFGGRKSLAATTVAQAQDFLYERLVRFHPQLEGVRIERAWGGEVAITRDRLPHCGRLPDGTWYATGCNGSGVALNTGLGHAMAGAICGDDLPPFAELPAPTVPLHRWRRAWLPVVSTGLRIQDRRS